MHDNPDIASPDKPATTESGSTVDSDRPAYTEKPDYERWSTDIITDPSPEIAQQIDWPVPVLQRHKTLHSARVSWGDNTIAVAPGDVLEYTHPTRKEFLLVAAELPMVEGNYIYEPDSDPGRLLTFSNRINDYRVLDLAEWIPAPDDHTELPVLFAPADNEQTIYIHHDAAPTTQDAVTPSFPEIYGAKQGHYDVGTLGSGPEGTGEPEPEIEPSQYSGSRSLCRSDITNEVLTGDCRDVLPEIQSNTVDTWITSPPYWTQRDYGTADQIGTEPNPEAYLEELLGVITECMRLLRPHGTGWVVIDDTYSDGHLETIPQRLAVELDKQGFQVITDGPWAKPNTMPDPAPNRPSHTHEKILGITHGDTDTTDQLYFHKRATENQSDVYEFEVGRSDTDHDAVFPETLPAHLLDWSAPETICSTCGQAYYPTYEVTDIRNLDESRPQARRALEKADAADLSDDHLWALRSVGLSATGQAKRVQDGAGNNASEVEKLAAEARDVLGSYAREFTNPQKEYTGHEKACDCETTDTEAPLVLDPFLGSGTTAIAAVNAGISWCGIEANEEYASTARENIATARAQPSLDEFA